MKPNDVLLRALCTGCLVALACGPNVELDDSGTDTDGSTSLVTETTGGPGTSPLTTNNPETTAPPTASAVTTSPPDTGTVTTFDPSTTGGSESTAGPGCVGDCPALMLDVVVVVDNSARTAAAQYNLAGSALGLVNGFRDLTDDLDVRVLVTTTDYGNPLCTPFEPEGYDPARGAPISTPCLERLDDFTGLGQNAEDMSDVCTDYCPAAIAPVDPFLAFDAIEDNVADGDAVAALQCLLPQGNVGCGYEAQLENMLQALNPGACWNSPGGCSGNDEPFLREQAKLAVVMVTNEADCSVTDYSLMENQAYQNVNPSNGQPQASSAICWNAGVSCDGPDGNGVYTNCTATGGNGLQPTSRYVNYLVDELVGNQNKDVYMLGLFGIPEDGVDNLVIRDWQDGQFPAGDILPDDFAAGVTAADQQFNFGIGPGCTNENVPESYTQAVPPVRMREVCEALDVQDGMHCCLQSICGTDYTQAMDCLLDMVASDLE